MSLSRNAGEWRNESCLVGMHISETMKAVLLEKGRRIIIEYVRRCLYESKSTDL